MSQVKLISRRQKQSTHVHWQKICAVPTSNRYRLEQTCARNTHLYTTKYIRIISSENIDTYNYKIMIIMIQEKESQVLKDLINWLTKRLNQEK